MAALLSQSLTIRQWLEKAKQQLASSEQPLLEAEILLAHTLAVSRSYLYTRSEEQVDEGSAATLTYLLQRRSQKEPIAYIIGKHEFWSLELKVSQDTLIPRPETELLVELALALFPEKDKKLRVADLGTGSGAIALALSYERPLWQIDATDISHEALRVAGDNAKQLALPNITFWHGDWCAALPLESHRSFDMIVSNPPYIAESEWEHYKEGLAFEPRHALTSGLDGLDAIRRITQTVKPYLATGGYLMVEHGWSQSQVIQEVFTMAGYSEIQSFRDLAGLERVVVGRYFS